MKIHSLFASACLVLGLAVGCKPKDPDTTLERGAGTGTDEGFNGGVNGTDFAAGAGSGIDAGFGDDPLAPLDPTLEGFNDPANVIRPFESVYFGFDQHGVAPSERGKLEEVATFLKENPRARLVIEGHCDWLGTPEYNKSLGDRRATSVKNYLMDLGGDPARIEVVAIGDEQATPNAGASQARLERKAQFLVLKGS